MKNLILAGICSLASLQLSAQTTVSLQPDALAGKDATIWYLTNQNGIFGATNTTPIPNDESFQAMQWTWNGASGVRKSLLDFDLSSIPANSVITSARLSLYAFPASLDGGHSSLSGSNACYIHEISSPWTEASVTWNMQPTVYSSNPIVLTQSSTEFDDYLDIDVTTIIQNKYSNPSASHGFMLSIINANYYRKMIFASSDHSDPNKRPKLEVTYTQPTNQAEVFEEAEFLLYPNPATNHIYIKTEFEFSYSLTDIAGRTIIGDTASIQGVTEVNLESIPEGLYVLSLSAEGKKYTRKIQVN